MQAKLVNTTTTAREADCLRHSKKTLATDILFYPVGQFATSARCPGNLTKENTEYVPVASLCAITVAVLRSLVVKMAAGVQAYRPY